LGRQTDDRARAPPYGRLDGFSDPGGGFILKFAPLALVVLVGCSAPRVHAASPTVFNLASRLPAFAQANGGNLGEVQWVEHIYTARTNEPVDVAVSASYPPDQPIAQHWADFFAGLPHGPELARLKAHIAPLSEVQTICGGGAVGCYGDNQLIVTNEQVLGFAPEEVARHEYGHHIALNRSNAPWPALDWGSKRWATAARICSRVRWNSAYPGDESLLYKLNPGEAFAEAYRVLVDTQAGEARPSWPLVDASFYPDQAALDAVEQDIVNPWLGPTALDFRAHGKVWEHRVPTPLDGTLTVRLARSAGLVLIGDDGRALRPTIERKRSLAYQICGQRSVTVRVISRSDVTQLRVTTP
jgi:hypothetical protein